MITAFTDLLKSTLMVKKAAVPLEDEFESARKYLVVQKLRYGDKVHFELDLGPGTGQMCIRDRPRVTATAARATGRRRP